MLGIFNVACSMRSDIGEATVDGWPIFVPDKIGIHLVLRIDGHQQAPMDG